MYTTEFDGTIASPKFGQLRVRALGPDDAPLLAAFFRGLSERSRGWFRPHTYTREGAARVVEQAGAPNALYFLVLHGEVPAAEGFLTNLQSDRPTLGIAVGDAYQDAGIGRLLMRFLVDVARRLGRRGVRLTVDDDNPRAIHVYERLGFKLVRVMREMAVDFPEGPGEPSPPPAGAPTLLPKNAAR